MELSPSNFCFFCLQVSQENLKMSSNKTLQTELKKLETVLEPTEDAECHVVSVCVIIY